MIQDAVAQTFSAEILDHLPDVIIWYKPLHDSNGVIDDFEISYANKPAFESYHHKFPSLIGLRLLKDAFPSANSAQTYFTHFTDVYHQSYAKVFRLNVDHHAKYLEIKCSRYLNGVLCNCQDRSTEWEAARKEEDKSMMLDGIIAHAPVGILVYETLRDKDGGIIDFRVKLYNEIVHRLTGISEDERKRLSLKEVMITLNTEKLYDRYQRTVETGEPFSLEYFNIRMHAWFQVSVVKLGDGFLTILTDISALKYSQQELEKQTLFVNSVLDASLNGICVMGAVRDEAGNVIDLIFIQGNGKYTELTGRPIEGLIGKSLIEQFPDTKENGFFQGLQKVVTTGEPHEYINYYATSFQRWYNIIAVKLGDDNVVVTFQEVTQQREANLLIERQKNMLDKILRHSPSGITVYRAVRDQARNITDFKFVIANDAAEKGGYIAKLEDRSETVVNVAPHIKGSLIVEMGKSVMEKGEPFQTEYFSGESKKWLELSFSKMDDNHIINVVTDITHVKESQLQLESLIEDLKNSNESLEGFAYAASHDLQEPLRKIHTFSDRLKHDLSAKLNESQLLLFDRIKSTTERMRNLIEDLLTYSLLNKNSDFGEDVDLNKIVQQVIAGYQPLIREVNATISTDELGHIKGNRLQLTQLIQNLLSNSLKYRKPDVPLVVSISCRMVNESDPEFKTLLRHPENYLLIQVKDNGIGFEQEHAEKIFQVFQRLHGQSQYQGTGVGLAIVEKVVRNHKGAIYAESEPGKGTTINILLPAT